MLEKNSCGSASSTPESLGAHLTEFLARLATAGYAETTQRQKRRRIVAFIEWAEAAQLAVTDLDDACVAAFLLRPICRRHKHGDAERAALHQFLDHLRTAGVVPPRCSSPPSPTEMLVGRYVDHLRSARGLCTRSVEAYLPFVRSFVMAVQLPERVAFLDASSVRSHLLERIRARSVSFASLLTAALRSFLRFLFFDGVTTTDLSTAVPPVRRWRLADVPPFLTAEEVEQVIAATDCSTERGYRAFAILLLLARLGLRAGEVVGLEIDDLDWNAGEIVVCGKGQVRDRLPLLKDVGEALAAYLREARPPSTSRRVFLRRRAPHVGLSGPSVVCEVARESLRRAGLQPAGRAAAHIFRHSLATRMIRGGASLGEISQVLRHRSIDSTQLYAKVEFEALRGVAMAWPTTEDRS